MTVKKALEAIALAHYGRQKLIPDDMHLFAPADWEIARAALGKSDRCQRFPRYSGKTPPGDCIQRTPGRRDLDGEEVPYFGWPCSTCLAKWFARNGAKRIPKKRTRR